MINVRDRWDARVDQSLAVISERGDHSVGTESGLREARGTMVMIAAIMWTLAVVVSAWLGARGILGSSFLFLVGTYRYAMAITIDGRIVALRKKLEG